MKTAILSILAITASSLTFGQTVLTSGDVIVTAIFGDDSDAFQFVPLVDLSAGTEIFFTDNGWMDTGLRTGENTTTYTAPLGGVNNGTVINAIDGFYSSDFSGTLNGISASGDQVLAYQVNSGIVTPIFIVTNSSTTFHSGTNDSNQTGLPTGLIDGTTAVAVGNGSNPEDEFDNAYFDFASHSVSGLSKSAVLALVADASKWIKTNTRPADTALTGVSNITLSVKTNHIITNLQLTTINGEINTSIGEIVSIYNALGQRVANQNLPKGVYVVTVKSNNQRAVKKVFVK